MNCVRLIVCGVAAGSLALGALAQDQKPAQAPAPRAPGEGGPRGPGMGMGGRQLSPEKAKAAWEMQAKGVAARLGLNDAQTKTLVSAYQAARESQGTASDKIRQEGMQRAQEGGGGIEAMRETMKKVDEVNNTERENFAKALAGSLNSEQSAKAVAALGTFDRQWDRLVDVFGSFKLDAAQQQSGLNAIEEYSASISAAQAKARAAGQGGGPNAAPGEGGAPGAGGPDREAMRAATQESRQKLVSALQPMLNKEQLTKIEESLPGAGRGPGGGRRGGGGGS